MIICFHFVILANAGSTDYVDKIKLVVDYFRQNKGENNQESSFPIIKLSCVGRIG